MNLELLFIPGARQVVQVAGDLGVGRAGALLCFWPWGFVTLYSKKALLSSMQQ